MTACVSHYLNACSSPSGCIASRDQPSGRRSRASCSVWGYAMSRHELMACRLCEAVTPGAYRRHWKGQGQAGYWHVIVDRPDLMARLPRPAHFVTILSYREAPDGAPAQYRGSLYWEYDAANPGHTLEELRRCMALLEVAYGCPLEAVRVWHSGHGGFHVAIPAAVVGAQTGHPLLTRIYAAMIGRLFPPHLAPSLDRSIYSMGKGRMWRLPNRRRADNGRYKVPVAVR